MAQARSTKTADKASSDVKSLVIAAGVLTLVAGLGGWFLGANLGETIVPVSHSIKAATDVKIEGEAITSNSNVTILPPILSNLASPSNAWVRMEIALVSKPDEKISPEIAAEISNDFLALLRESTMSQIKGPTGLMYLREDLLDRASTRSEGKVSHILISSLVIEQ